LRATKIELGSVSRDYNLAAYPDARSLFRYEMRTLPSGISDAIGTSTLWTAWNAAVYVAKSDDGRLSAALADRAYLIAGFPLASTLRRGRFRLRGAGPAITRRANRAP